MTPKEKAQEILTMLIDAGINQSSLKLVATIAVNEILNNFGSLSAHYATYYTIQYYTEVKQEIQKYDSN